MTPNRSAAADMLYGTRAIADHLGIRPRQALHMVETGRLPHFRVGKIICARRSTLMAWLAKVERDAPALPRRKPVGRHASAGGILQLWRNPATTVGAGLPSGIGSENYPSRK